MSDQTSTQSEARDAIAKGSWAYDEWKRIDCFLRSIALSRADIADAARGELARFEQAKAEAIKLGARL